jgi:hypothetical protein
MDGRPLWRSLRPRGTRALASRVITVVPLYYGSDDEACATFSRANESDLNTISGNRYYLVYDEAPVDPADVEKAVDANRFPGLKHSAIPCLWVETRKPESFPISLRGKRKEQINHYLRLLSDLIEAKTPFADLKGQLMQSDEPTAPAPQKGDWGRNLVTLIVLLAFGLAGFYFLESLVKAVLWFVFVLVVAPVILAYVQNAQSIKGKSLLDLYRIGVAQLPFIGDLLAKVFGRTQAKPDAPSVRGP